MTFRTSLLAALAVVGASAGAQAATFDLSNSVGKTPTFSIASGGQIATFSSTAGNGFVVGNTAGLLTFSPALEDMNFFGSDPLTITFSSPVFDRIVIPFAVFDAFGFSPASDAVTVTTSNSRVLNFTATPTSLTLGEPQGVIDFVPSTTGLTSLTLTSSFAFAIGNVAVPEPMSLALLATGLVGLAASRRRV